MSLLFFVGPILSLSTMCHLPMMTVRLSGCAFVDVILFDVTGYFFVGFEDLLGFDRYTESVE